MFASLPRDPTLAVLTTASGPDKVTARLVFAMEVGEKLTFDEYWTDARFQRKKADRRGS
jgi:Nucleotide modification associated domain 2